MSLVISTRCGIGGANPDLPFGNKVEEVTASLDDGTWQVHTWTPDGTVTRAATDAEAAGFEARVAPPAAPVNPVEQVAVAVTTAIDAAPNTVAGVKAAIRDSLGQFIS